MQKYEILYKKEKEINEYMEKFEQEQEGYNKQIKEAQVTIEALLMHMQKTLARQKKLPSSQAVEEMREDLNFKQRQLNDAERTAAQLQVEVGNRRQDLQKYKNLEKTIKSQMEEYEQSLQKMEDELANKFPKTNELS